MNGAVRRYLDELVVRATQVLGLNLIGAYAAGSIGLDAYQPGRSDVDVALVVADAIPHPQKVALVAALRHEALPCPARGLELVAYRSAVVRSGTAAPGFEVELNTGPSMGFRETYDPDARPASDGRFWYGLDRSILHQSGRALLGPPAAETFADLAPGDLKNLPIEALSWWLALPTPDDGGPAPGAEDAVLGACRSLVKWRCGHWLPKIEAGRQIVAAPAGEPSAVVSAVDTAPTGDTTSAVLLAVDTAPAGVPAVATAASAVSSDLIERAIAARSGGTPPTGPEARSFQRWVLTEIRREHHGSAG